MARMRKPARVVQLALCTKGQLHNCTNIAGTAFKSVLGWVGLGDYAGGVAFHQRVKRSVVSGADGSVSGRSGRLGVGNCGIKRFDG